MEALLPLIITFGLMWALLIRPQQRRVRQHQELVATLSAGDEVITSGGIVGTIVSVVDDIVTLEVAPETSIRVLRSAVQSRIAPFEAADAAADDDYHDDDYHDDDLEDAFAEDAFDAEPVAEPRQVAPTDITTTIPQATPPTSTPPTSTPPTSTPPTSTPPPTGEKA